MIYPLKMVNFHSYIKLPEGMYHGNSLRFQGSYNYIRFFGCSRPFHSYNWDIRIHMKAHISIWKFTTTYHISVFRLLLNCWCLIGSWFSRKLWSPQAIASWFQHWKFHHSPWDNLWVRVVSQGGWKGCYITLCRWDGGRSRERRVENLWKKPWLRRLVWLVGCLLNCNYVYL